MLKIVLAATVLIVVSIVGEAPQAADLPTGIWRDAHYGYLLDIGRRSTHMYDVVDSHCVPHEKFRNNDLVDQLGMPEQPSEDALVFASATSRYHYQRLAALPLACKAKSAATPERVLALMVATLRAHHADREGLARLEAIEAAQRVRATTVRSDADLFALLSETVAPLQDAHVELSDGDTRSFEAAPGTIGGVARADAPSWKTQRWELKAFLESPESPLIAAPRAAGNRRLLMGELPADVGYLAVLAMGGYSDELGAEAGAAAHALAAGAVFDEVLADMADKRGLVIDLRYNEGGFDGVALALAARLATAPVRAFGKRVRGPAGTSAPHFTEVAPTGNGFGGPIAVLVGPYTISAGEVGALALAALPNVVLIGQPTFGAWSDALPKVLPNGWSFTIAPETYLDASGTSLHAGLLPAIDADTPVLGQPQQRYAPAIAAATDWLARSANLPR